MSSFTRNVVVWAAVGGIGLTLTGCGDPDPKAAAAGNAADHASPGVTNGDTLITPDGNYDPRYDPRNSNKGKTIDSPESKAQEAASPESKAQDPSSQGAAAPDANSGRIGEKKQNNNQDKPVRRHENIQVRTCDGSQLECDVFAIVNQYRKENGKQPFEWYSLGAALVRNHALEGWCRGGSCGKYAHEGAEQRMKQVGQDNSWHEMAENAYAGDTRGTLHDAAMRTVDGWKKSGYHNKNMLSPSTTHAGVGSKINEGGKTYVAMIYVG